MTNEMETLLARMAMTYMGWGKLLPNDLPESIAKSVAQSIRAMESWSPAGTDFKRLRVLAQDGSTCYSAPPHEGHTSRLVFNDQYELTRLLEVHDAGACLRDAAEQLIARAQDVIDATMHETVTAATWPARTKLINAIQLYRKASRRESVAT